LSGVNAIRAAHARAAQNNHANMMRSRRLCSCSKTALDFALSRSVIAETAKS
jgi:hypothetical protein